MCYWQIERFQDNTVNYSNYTSLTVRDNVMIVIAALVNLNNSVVSD